MAIGGKWVFLLALQWFDKNIVTMLSNKHGDDMKPYEYKAKGEVDMQESVQPFGVVLLRAGVSAPPLV